MSRLISLPGARRIALAAQGFDRPRPTGRIDVRHFRRVLHAVSLVQIDSVNVLARAHYLPFYSRLGPYPMESLDRWLWESGEVFEYWAHEASLLPIERRPLLRPWMVEAKTWRRAEQLERDQPGYLDAVLDEVRRRGPLTVSELDDPGGRTGPWWGYGKGKIALEHHFAFGNVTVAGRRNFTRHYDVPERVHPTPVLDLPDAERDVAILELLALGARAHGIGTVEDFADYYRLPITEARSAMPDLVDRGDVVAVEVDGWTKPAFVHVDARRPRRIRARTFLAPFDPVVWFRPRVERLFGMRYRIEIYVPADKREFGYYVLPFLLGDELVGRADLKADRRASQLIVRSAHSQPGVDLDRVVAAMAQELVTMAGWLDLDEVAAVDGSGDLGPGLAVELARYRSSER